jgi:uncharacterized protein
VTGANIGSSGFLPLKGFSDTIAPTAKSQDCHRLLKRGQEMKTLQDLSKFIEGDSGLSQLQSEIVRTLSADPSHDLEHSLRVALWTCRIGAPAVPFRAAVAAALCHDIVNVPKTSPNRAKASLESAKKSRALLSRYGFDSNVISEIADAVRDHSYAHGSVPSTALGRALQDADRLDALGAIGIIRNISTAVQNGAKLFDQNDPWAERRPLDEYAFAIDHYFTKLLKLPGIMCTDLGRREAARRVKTMTVFLDELATELSISRP